MGEENIFGRALSFDRGIQVALVLSCDQVVLFLLDGRVSRATDLVRDSHGLRHCCRSNISTVFPSVSIHLKMVAVKCMANRHLVSSILSRKLITSQVGAVRNSPILLAEFLSHSQFRYYPTTTLIKIQLLTHAHLLGINFGCGLQLAVKFAWPAHDHRWERLIVKPVVAQVLIEADLIGPLCSLHRGEVLVLQQG